MGELNCIFIDTAMITSVLKTNEKKSQNKMQTTENVDANVKYVVFPNIRLVGKLAGVLPSHNFSLKLKKKKKKENQKETEEERGTLIPCG